MSQEHDTLSKIALHTRSLHKFQPITGPFLGETNSKYVKECNVRTEYAVLLRTK